jgi:outer membrane immunogenic protein
MKRVVAGILTGLAVGATSAAFATDLPARMEYKAPPPLTEKASVYNWTGFYLGAHIGYGRGRQTWVDTDPTSIFFTMQVADYTSRGVLGGAQAGYLYQIGQFVLGVETRFSWSGINATLTTTLPPAGVSFATHTRTIWDVAGRLGYTPMDRWLVYVRGGPAWSRNTADLNQFTVGAATSNDPRTGWTVGGGIEWAFLDNWSALLEYNYYDFGTRNITFTAPVAFGTTTLDIKQQVQTVMLGIDYHFAGMGWLH